jgi:hypothetical protein
MKRKAVIFGVIVVAIIGGAWYGYKEYTRKVRDIADIEAQVALKTNELIAAFEKDEKAANAQYLDKIIAVAGNVKTIEKDDRGYCSIVLGDKGNNSSVRCSMDMAHAKDILNINEGKEVTIKGACTGFNADELLGSDIILNRCVIDNKKK